MATCKQTAAELIQDVFSPCVAVFCSSDVEVLCAKNNLTFVEMVQPFCRLTTEVSMRDPSNIPCNIRNLRVVMKDMTSQAPPINLGKKMMHDAVASNAPTSSNGILLNSVTADDYQINYCATAPWFEAYREVFFQVFSPTDHEFIHHYLSCIFVVSSSHQDPLSQLNDLCQLQAQQQIQNSRHSSKWFFSYILKYYVLIHDTSDENLAKAEAIYQSMKSSFGGSVCHLLQINSANASEGNLVNSSEDTNGAANLPDPWSQFLPKYYPQQDSTALNDINSENNESTNVESPVREFDMNMSSSNKGVIINHPLLNNSDEVNTINNSNAIISNNERARSLSNSLNYWGKSNNRNKKHGLCLTSSDMDRIRVFVQDFCLQGLIPFVEKHIRILSDQVTNRKSIHRTIFGVTKKFFAGNKPGVQSPTASVNSVVYGQDALELQVRKLGDLAFMFQMYEVAYQAYHTAKRDFSADNAWLYFAGAAEMAALSIFMQGNTMLHEYPARYIETAISTYLLTCKFAELAMRATFLSTECLKAKGLYRDAALQFVRMPSEADLPCALFLEQAAHCFINCRPQKVRKYAFHIVLAGHRYSKAGQRKHAQRSYRLAEQIYKSLSWKYANNHINLMIGRFSMYLNQLETACSAFKELLVAQSHQPAAEQANYLKEYLLSLKQYLSQHSSHENYQLPTLPIPVIDCQSTKVLLSEDNLLTDDGALVINGRGFERGDLNNEVWAKMEEMLVLNIQKILPPIFNPQLYCLTQKTDNTNKPVAVTNETITVEITMQNLLNVAFVIDNVFLLWTFTTLPEPNGGKDLVSFSNELDFSKAMMLNSVVQTEVLPRVSFEPLAILKIHLTLKPVHIGSLLIRGLAYSLLSPINQSEESPSDSPAKVTSVLSMQGKQIIDLQGPRLNRTVDERTQMVYALDNRLNLEIVPPMPKLQVKYKSFPCDLFCGEVQSTIIEFSNCGEQSLHKLFIASPTPGVFALGPHSETEDLNTYKNVPSGRHTLPVSDKWTNADWKTEVLSTDGSFLCLSPRQSTTCLLWIRGPDMPGEHIIQLLFYYGVEQPHPKLSYRLVQHCVIINTRSSLSLHANAMPSLCSEELSQTDKDSVRYSSSSASPLTLSLEIGNISDELMEIDMMQISCISPKWHLSSNAENLSNGFPAIHTSESLFLTFKALGYNTGKEVCDPSQEVMVFSHIPFGHFEIDSSLLPCSEFTNKSLIPLINFLNIDNQKELEARTNADSRIQMQLLLTVIWKAKIQNDSESLVVCGQHHITIENTSSSDAHNLAVLQPEKMEVSDNYGICGVPMAATLAKCSLNHPFHVQHNFKKKRLITVPVEFIAQSTCSIVLQMTIDNVDVTSSQSLLYNFEEGQTAMTQSFTWISGSKRELTLNPGEKCHLHLQASFCHPGTYNLGCLNVSIRCGKETAVNYIMSPYPIVISACDLPIH